MKIFDKAVCPDQVFELMNSWAEDTPLDAITTEEHTVFPNPVERMLYIRTNQWVEKASLLSLDGKRSNLMIHKEANGYTLDLENCLPGIYLLQLNREDKYIKIIVR